MNRVIKFRAFNSHDKEMYGHAVALKLMYDKEIKGEDYDSKWTILQFTGLTDKNGKEIYEGDVVNYIGTNMSTMTVKFENGCFVGEGMFTTRPLIDYITATDFLEIEVIGNTHQPPTY